MVAGRIFITDDGVHHVLRLSPTTWESQIAADLIAEIEPFIEKVESMPELRRQLAVKGYRGLKSRIEDATKDATGAEAIAAMAHAMRGYALAKPGLAAASFRSLDVTSSEWDVAGAALADTVMRVFGSYGLEEAQAAQAVLILRSLVRGFVINEMSTPNSSLDFHSSFAVAVRVFTHGLAALKE